MKDNFDFKINLQLFSYKSKFSVIIDNTREEKGIYIDTPIDILHKQDSTKKPYK
ncbi:hypothetical protein Curi_c14710 [Gottschalkia acidurici 9a]|uniref:Uncharacterized protein n=1 Tax=Gottschalkia acidurici (strain ATCC 7906 / DSM 604 / BCRC 14475 / CIP 104303 / KCTC 5404 / NCIMB 10678 / 9a) TaxID=1128398 RepID=K0B1E3_GOTA9|nr:hypothetical protein Curi_c14710 [Gottschalkia acidurici 9a]